LRGVRVGLIGRRLIAFDEILGDARGRAGNAARKHRFALARQLFLAVERVGVENLGGIELAALGAGAKDRHKHQREQRADANEGWNALPLHRVSPCCSRPK
jgi:hypothetical protein